ncbi:MAG: 5-methylthioadenosine/S-adenosylhomocysteine deaminase [Bradyrhizobium sp.]|jgi:5-methylthioadenosine/S-adenosylhomocysteine deaminase|nr:5-methylthioadenosine/S-adenosylhomocysteine deaminase [Bradyrhizobium sp.]
MRSLLITGGRVLDPLGELHRPPVMDILIEDGKISAMGATATLRGQTYETMDASGLLITPGFINAHCHSHDTLLRGLFEQTPLELWGLTAFPFHWSRRRAEEISVRTQLHAVECLRGGMTTIQDMVTLVDFDREHAEALASAYADSGIEALVAPQFSDLGGAAGIPFAADLFSGGTRLKLGSDVDPESVTSRLESLFDEVSAERLRWELGPVQPQICSDALLKHVAAMAQERQMKIFTHLYETRSEAVLARSLTHDGGSMVQRLRRVGLLTERLTVAHGVWITPSEIDVLADTGVSLATNPVTNLKLMNGIAPVNRYRSRGVNIGLGCDNSSASDAQSIFQAMKLFALVWGMQAGADDRSAATEAFSAATIGGAAAIGLAGTVGRVAPGFRANLAFIDLSDPSWRPLNSAVRQLVYGETGRALRHVMVQGKLLVTNGRMASIDENRLCEDAERLRAAMAKELDQKLNPDKDVTQAYRAMLAKVETVSLEINPRFLQDLPGTDRTEMRPS